MSQTLFREASPAAREKAAPGFVCTSRGGDVGVAWVHVAGELDLATSPRLEQTLRRAQGRAGLVVLDLRELAFMDCVGMHVIVDAAIRARRDYRRLIVVRAPAPVDKVFTVTGAFQHLKIIDLPPGAKRNGAGAATGSRLGPSNSYTNEPDAPTQGSEVVAAFPHTQSAAAHRPPLSYRAGGS